MELGNMAFGNSRGNFSVERDVGFEEELHKLFSALGSDTSYGVIFENKTFSTFPYYWGECTCGFEDKEEEFYENNGHRHECIHYEIERSMPDKWLTTNMNDLAVIKHIYIRRGLDVTKKNWHFGWGVACDCDLREIEEKFYLENTHTACPITKPNFLYKPTGFSIKWYKYFLRDAYFSEKISLPKFKIIIENCISSLTMVWKG